jgi:hypothetical protein
MNILNLSLLVVALAAIGISIAAIVQAGKTHDSYGPSQPSLDPDMGRPWPSNAAVYADSETGYADVNFNP